ncbi:hypothetical protein G6F50_014717 [Rhizopus delemar]|uniref:Uncharacterized protein n=1 Tax=Rhizopus delemar TaxID=936053 RepID=A0A9P6Y2W6_9FUNG|nr:hypothetical protein G6F50_014717 [Rhizopus delemar]
MLPPSLRSRPCTCSCIALLPNASRLPPLVSSPVQLLPAQLQLAVAGDAAARPLQGSRIDLQCAGASVVDAAALIQQAMGIYLQVAVGGQQTALVLHLLAGMDAAGAGACGDQFAAVVDVDAAVDVQRTIGANGTAAVVQGARYLQLQRVIVRRGQHATGGGQLAGAHIDALRGGGAVAQVQGPAGWRW